MRISAKSLLVPLQPSTDPPSQHFISNHSQNLNLSWRSLCKLRDNFFTASFEVVVHLLFRKAIASSLVRSTFRPKLTPSVYPNPSLEVVYESVHPDIYASMSKSAYLDLMTSFELLGYRRIDHHYTELISHYKRMNNETCSEYSHIDNLSTD